jgi:hypothetical protein
MAQSVQGITPLQWGTVVTSGYVTESTSEKHTGGETEIIDEIGDIVAHISNYGEKTETTLEVMPKSSGATMPTNGTLFTWGPSGSTKTIIVSSCEVKSTKGAVQIWTITGNRYPGITPS